ncbi:MAG: class D beta-lactamase [Candidatus Omnitrophica bacterium]|nr:class D beta-lactamase [Candidatus Omnitrophota bacterium]
MRILILIFIVIINFNSAPAHAKDDFFTACDVSGSTTLYDLNKNQWYKTNAQDTQMQTLPASTFKIFHTLIGLETGATTLDELFKWDGTVREYPAWNQDTQLYDAFKNSTVWVYEELAKRIDITIYQKYLSMSEYEGNGNINHGQNGNFWVYGNWGISPKEQINMLVKLYQNKLPFSISTMDAVKKFMKEGNTYGKTGWTRSNGQHIGWWIGYKDLSNGPIFFATRIRKDTDQELGNFISCRKTITDQIIVSQIEKLATE